MPIKKNKSKIQQVILVNANDRRIGIAEKIVAHQYAMLHRAFSVLIFRRHGGKLQTLLQQRSKHKYYGGGLWTNACCSHPRPGEINLIKAARERLKEEMGITAKLEKKGVFHYVASFDNGLFENEIDHVFIGMYDGKPIQFNPKEVDDYQWVDIASLKDDLNISPQKYSPWLNQALTLALSKKL